MSPPLPRDAKVETKSEAEALIPLFKLQKVLNQDQNGRRITLLGTINSLPAVFSLERAAFPSDAAIISTFLETLTNTTNLGANDIYRWYMSNSRPSSTSSRESTPLTNSLSQRESGPSIPDLKLTLIYPCTESHIKKYTAQSLRHVTETPEIYRQHIQPYVEQTQRTPKRLEWIYNILDGITEQEDVIYRSPDYDTNFTTITATTSPQAPGFLLLPDLNWDRKTLTSMRLLALPQRHDLSSLRSLRKSDIPWLSSMLSQIKTAAAQRGTELAAAAGSTEVMDADQIKCYVHYQPTYYHFHIHVVHVMQEPEGGTQSVGKAFGVEMLITMLEGLTGDGDRGLDGVDITYFVGEESEIWKRCFGKIKTGERVDLLDE